MTIREAIIDWLTGGRYQRIMETYERLVQKQYEHSRERLAEKDAQIRLLRVELQQARSGLVPPPPTNSVSVPRKSAVESRPAAVASDMTLDWNGELRRLIEEEQDGLRKHGREEIHKQTSDDGA